MKSRKNFSTTEQIIVRTFLRFNLIALVYNRQLKSVSCYSSTAASVSAVLNISLKQALLDVHKQKKAK